MPGHTKPPQQPTALVLTAPNTRQTPSRHIILKRPLTDIWPLTIRIIRQASTLSATGLLRKHQVKPRHKHSYTVNHRSRGQVERILQYRRLTISQPTSTNNHALIHLQQRYHNIRTRLYRSMESHMQLNLRHMPHRTTAMPIPIQILPR